MLGIEGAVVRRQVGSAQVGQDVIHYETATPEGVGNRAPVVLIHGSGGNRATWWPVVAELASERSVVTLDVRGSGRSTDVARALGPEQVAEDLEAVRAEAGIDRWHVVGHSFGGWHALRYAATHPNRTVSTVSVASVAGCITAEVQDWMQGFAKMAAMWSAGDRLGRSASLSTAFVDQHPEQAHLYQLLRDLNPPPVRGVPGERMSEVALAPDQLARLGVMRVLFVAAAEDPLAPPAVVQAATRAIPRAQVVELAAAGHMCFWERPGAFLEVLRRWLD